MSLGPDDPRQIGGRHRDGYPMLHPGHPWRRAGSGCPTASGAPAMGRRPVPRPSPLQRSARVAERPTIGLRSRGDHLTRYAGSSAVSTRVLSEWTLGHLHARVVSGAL